MANITTIEPIRYGQHALTSDASGLIIIPPTYGLDYSLATTINGFTIAGEAPENTSRAVAFLLSETWVKLNSDGSTAALPTQKLTVDSLLAEGNAPEDLPAVTSVPSFTGQRIGLAYALWAEDPEGDMPSVSVVGNAISNQTVLTQVEASPTFTINGVLKVVDTRTDTTGGGSVLTEARTSADGGSTWTEWGDPEELIGTDVGSMQLRATLTVVTPNSDAAAISSAALTYTPDGASSTSEIGTVSVVSLTEDWHDDLSVCNLTLYHQPLVNASIRAYVAFRNETTYATREVVGTGTGAPQAYTFVHQGGIKLDTVQAYVDGVQVYNFTADTAAGTITLTAAAGSLVSVNYEYGWESEDWRQMTLSENRQSVNGQEQSRFVYSIPPEQLANQTVATVKIELETKEDSVTNETVGVGTGSAKSYRLSHYVKDQSIALFANGINIQTGNWFISDVDAQVVTVLAPQGTTITANYNWISETPVIYKYIAIFA
ncbi:MAG: hypothetical protein LBQ42_13720 [Synergistaceae bacterium]|jgi:hypothetical protein|nr:hypothetical protein [Synergistaceae bacterium]